MKPSIGKMPPQESSIARKSDTYQGLFYRLLMLAGVVMLVSQIVISWIALKGFEQDLKPEINQKSIAVGRALISELSYAVNDLGVPVNELVGVDEYFKGIMDSNSDIRFLAIFDPSSHQLLYERNLPEGLLNQIQDNLSNSNTPIEPHRIRVVDQFVDSEFPIYSGGEPVAILHVGVSGASLQKQLATIFYEVVSVIVVSMVITLEFLMLFMSMQILGPTAHLQRVLEAGSKGIFTDRVQLKPRNEIGVLVASLNRLLYHLEQRYQDFQFELRELRDAQIDPLISQKIAALKQQAEKIYRFSDQFREIEKTPTLIRVPFFLFIFSEELSRSFFPLFVGSLVPIEPVLSYEVMIGLPITLFMTATFAATLFAGGLTHRLGSSRLFLLGVGCAFIGYLGTFLSDSYLELVVWRCLNGIGYGLIFNACETWVALHAKESNRAYSASSFVGAVFAGIVCGPSLGGMFADYVGPQATFLISAGLSILSGLTAYRLLGSSKSKSVREENKVVDTPRILPWKVLFSNARFIGVVLTAVPTKTTLSGFLFFMVPLYLNELGYTKTQTGQVMMLYGALILVGTPFVSRLADHTRRYTMILFSGSLMSGLGLIIILTGTYLNNEYFAVLIAIIALGSGHCLIMSPQFAIVQEIVYSYRDVIAMPVSISVYRFVDRVGLIIGPMLAALLVQKISYPHATAVFGIMVLVSMLLSMFAMSVHNHKASGRIV